MIKNMPSPDSKLPDRLKVKLNGTIAIGDLEVTPVRVELGHLKVYSETKAGREGPVTTRDALTLHLRIRNVSSKLSICPTDPMYDRRFNPEFSTAKPYTLIEVADRKFYGGPIDQLNLGALLRAYVEGQENDDKPLAPGEERVTVTCSDPTKPEIVTAAQGFNGTMVWRVQVRRGVVSFHGEEVPVTAVVGVEFTAADIKKVTRN